MRTDSLMLGDFTFAQVISVALIIAAIVAMIYRRKMGLAKPLL